MSFRRRSYGHHLGCASLRLHGRLELMFSDINNRKNEYPNGDMYMEVTWIIWRFD